MFNQTQDTSDSDSWLSISDLMSGLMIFFLFIAILYIQPLQKIKLNIEEIVTAWQEGEMEIYESLVTEFEDDLQRWNAEIDQDELTLRFNSPDVLFQSGDASLKTEFKQIINDFFPRYLNVLEPYYKKGIIEEIRIEGHTSSHWGGGASKQQAYYLNMELSQNRTRSVLQYAFNLPQIAQNSLWALPLVTANGLASSRPILLENSDNEDFARSRRVEFRVRTTTQNQMNAILQQFDKTK